MGRDLDIVVERDAADAAEGSPRQNGVRPEIAKHLVDNGNNGRPVGPAIDRYAAHLGVEPSELVQWLNQQDPAWVEDFVRNGLHQIEPGDDGSVKATGAGENCGKDAGPRTHEQPSTLEELERWCELTGRKPPGT
jgi:hypothetical protein